MGELTALPRPPGWILGEEGKREMDEKGRGKGEGKRKGMEKEVKEKRRGI